MGSVRVAVAVGLGLLLAGLLAAGLRHPDELARSNGVTPEGEFASAVARVRFCQSGEAIPRGSTAIVAWLGAFTGPRVSVQASEGGHLVGHGEHGSGWTGRSVTIALAQPSRALAHATVCFSVAPRDEVVTALGNGAKGAARLTVNGKPTPGRMTLEYLRPGRRTWLSHAAAIARHLGLGRLPSGTWAPIFAVLLMAAAVVVLVRSLLDRSR